MIADCSECDVNRIESTYRARSAARIYWSSFSPVMPGIDQSVMTIGQSCVCSSSQACAPFSASRTETPQCSN